MIPARGSRGPALLAVLVAAGLGPLPLGCRKTEPPATIVQIISTAPSAAEVGPADLQDGVRVVFDRPVAPTGSVGRVITGPALLITPEVAGQSRWLDPQTLAFFPRAPLGRSTAYEVKLDPGIVLAPGMKASAWGGMRFVHERMTVDHVRVSGPRELQPRKPLLI